MEIYKSSTLIKRKEFIKICTYYPQA